MDLTFGAITGEVVTTGITWLWDKYGERIADFGTEKLKNKWTKLQWSDVETKYRERVLAQVNTTLLLGYPKPIKIDRIYTDVYVLDGITAKRKFNFEDLKKIPLDFEMGNLRQTRIKAEHIFNDSKRIFILGKPGAGKTTFLKYLAILACNGNLNKTPIYLSLKEWSDSGLEIHDFIEKQFVICGFPDPKAFVKSILQVGEALILLDGLDEVSQVGLERMKMIQVLTDLANQYTDCTFCLTCRVAASDYTFTQFKYVEIADFNETQKNIFIEKWYQDDPEKFNSFLKEWPKAENSGFRELAQTPLLLALLCLAFDETLQFSKRRVDLYAEALDALLKKWDSSRGVLRAEIYRKLSLNRKKQLLSRIAAKNFQESNYLLRKDTLVSSINDFLLQLPPDDKDPDPDAENVLSAIEYQHGLLVERAYGIYSFSHLSFQEYFTARYIIENQALGTLNNLIDDAIKDPRWREIVLMCSALLDDATPFIEIFATKIWKIIAKYQPIVDLIAEVEQGATASDCFRTTSKAAGAKHKKAANIFRMEFQVNSEYVLERCLELAAEFSFGKHDDYRPGYTRARYLAVLLHNNRQLSDVEKRVIQSFFEKEIYSKQFGKYLQISRLLVECLRISCVDDRKRLGNMVIKRLPS